MKILKNFTYLAILSFLYSCSDESEKGVTDLPPIIEDPSTPALEKSVKADFPKVYVEELDQFQEFFKEQHETSFSHVPNKNWMSFTAGKDGILTKILLFGKANYLISEHYGSAMRGFVRESNPNTGTVFGEWELSRDEIVNQLAAQGLAENEPGWITIRMRGEIPQEAGKTYFLVCKEIDDERPWFGAFAFSEGNNYLPGRHWLHPGHDLVFRTYVGKTSDQIADEQKAAVNFQPAQPNQDNIVNNSPVMQPPPPKPMTEQNPPVDTPVEYKPAVDVEQKKTTEAESAPNSNSEESKEVQEKSLFDRLFKKKNTNE